MLPEHCLSIACSLPEHRAGREPESGTSAVNPPAIDWAQHKALLNRVSEHLSDSLPENKLNFCQSSKLSKNIFGFLFEFYFIFTENNQTNRRKYIKLDKILVTLKAWVWLKCLICLSVWLSFGVNANESDIREPFLPLFW